MKVWLVKSTWMPRRNIYALVSGQSRQKWHSGSKFEGWQSSTFQHSLRHHRVLSVFSQGEILRSLLTWDHRLASKCLCPWAVLIIMQQGVGWGHPGQWKAHIQPVLHSYVKGINSLTAGDDISTHIFWYNCKRKQGRNAFTALRSRCWMDHLFSRCSMAVLCSEKLVTPVYLFNSSLSRRMVLKMGYLEMFRSWQCPNKGVTAFLNKLRVLADASTWWPKKESVRCEPGREPSPEDTMMKQSKETLSTHNYKRQCLRIRFWCKGQWFYSISGNW